MELVEEKKVVEIRPLSKWKRILLFLGDYFITFILSFILFNLAIFPLAKVICHTGEKNAQAAAMEKQADELLMSYGIIYEDPNGSNSFEGRVNHTFKVFLSYYAFDTETPDTAHPYYGHKDGNEPIKNYYLNYKSDEATYLNAFKDVNQKDQLFEIGSGVNDIALKSDYKILLGNELLEVSDESKYSDLMVTFRDNVFARLFYVYVYNDINENDVLRDGISYKGLLEEASNIMKPLQWIPVVSSFISIILSWGAVYLLYPMINGERRTPTMSIMKVNILHCKRFIAINRVNVLIHSFYDLVLNLSYSIVLPVLFFGFAYCFNLPLLFITSVIALALIITSLFFILFNQFNRSGSDLLTFTVAIPTSEIDNLYKEQHSDERSV